MIRHHSPSQCSSTTFAFINDFTARLEIEMITQLITPRLLVDGTLMLILFGCLFSSTCFAQAPLDGEAARPTNRLASESSPYLLQHAHNPVDWYPWGDEAFERARRENKMIFLSVGYAACHWCHVMERESFVDAEIAKVMNDRFVCIKVDREERPDVDQIYMLAVQLVTGNGGWPMSVFLTPDSKPFWGGTYFPARDGDRGNSTGFLSVMNQIDQAWKTQPDAVRAQAQSVTMAIDEQQQLAGRESATDGLPAKSVLPTEVDIRRVATALVDDFDLEFGGFGNEADNPHQPKFPEASKLVFLLDRAQRESVSKEDRERALDMLTKTLDGMISGAMWDHLGGGFHRYSVDRRWQIPHFEKMLYDNGQLASVFAAAYALTGRDEYRIVCERTCDSVLRDLLAPPSGDQPGRAFYSSLDADSEGEEGAYYRWTSSQLSELAKTIDGFDRLADVYRLVGEPNFDEEFFVPDPGRTLTAIATDRSVSVRALDEQLATARNSLWQVRQQRDAPATDTKILTAWNGLMITGLADAGRILGRDDYVAAASSAAVFLLREMPDERGRLRRSYADTAAKLNAYLDDYAMLVGGLLALHRATDDAEWLDHAQRLTAVQLQHYWDDEAGGSYFTSDDHPSLIVRMKDPLDGAVPSGNSITAENLAYLASVTGDAIYADRLTQTLASTVPMFRRAPAAVSRIAVVAASRLDHVD